MHIFSELSQIVFPTRCYGCNALGVSICTSCRREWIPHYYRTRIDALNVHSAMLYTPTASKIILAAKENGLQGADDLLITAIIHVLNKARLEGGYFTLVPIPSSKSAIRRRGESFLHPILDKLVELQKQKNGVRWRWKDHLIHQKSVRDQSELSYSARQNNMAGAFKVRSDELIEARPILLIDDVVTTGATLDSAVRALRERNLTVLGAATVCASAHRLLIR